MKLGATFSECKHIKQPPSKSLNCQCRCSVSGLDVGREEQHGVPHSAHLQGALFVEEKMEVIEQCCLTLSCCLSWSRWSLGPRRWRSLSDGSSAEETSGPRSLQSVQSNYCHVSTSNFMHTLNGTDEWMVGGLSDSWQKKDTTRIPLSMGSVMSRPLGA